MRIAVNTRLLIANKMDGIGWFTAETVRRIVNNHPEHEFYFFFDRKPDKQFIFGTNVHPVVLCPQARHPILWYLFFEWSMSCALRRLHIDLLLSTDGYIPTHTCVPTVNVIHDLNFEHASGNLKPSHQRYMTLWFPRFAQRSTRLATVSQYSKEDIATTYHINPNKIDVVYDGAHSNYQPLEGPKQQQVRNLYTGGHPYFIFISTILKRKNLANLLLAFDQLLNESRLPEPYKLVVVGSRVWWQDELEAAYNNMRHKDDVVFVGRAEPDKLAQLMASATALVYPSFFEGFGIPILEAFQAETPVITSNVTSMPEVAGDAALLIDPTSVDSIAEAMDRIASHPELQAELVQRGKSQRTLFSWDRTADLLWDCCMNALNPSSSR